MQDRFARDRIPPTIDEQQDWILEGGEEENGFTILEFSRKYVTCDDYDLPITVNKIMLKPILRLHEYFCRVKPQESFGVSMPPLTQPLRFLPLLTDTHIRELSVSTYWEVSLMQLLIPRTWSILISKLTMLVNYIMRVLLLDLFLEQVVCV